MEITNHLENALKPYKGSWPAAWLQIVVAYLSGNSDLIQVQKAWESVRSQVSLFDFFLSSLWERSREHLDTFDYRVLDLYLTTNSSEGALLAIALCGPADEALTYLMSQGFTSKQLLLDIACAEEVGCLDYGVRHQDFSASIQFLLQGLPADPNYF